MKFLRYLFPIIIVTFTSCKVTKNISDEACIIQLEKTACRGTCPVFSFKIYANGNVTYEGIKNVDKIGLYQGKLNQARLNEIILEFDKVNFFKFNDSYKSLMMDLPTKLISYSKNGITKRIKAYDDIPKELIQLIAKLDVIIESIEWKKCL
jgi:hypothetical protein